MAGNIGDYLVHKLLDHVLRGTTYTPPANLYLAASTADPNNDGFGLIEPAGGGYARVAVAVGTGSWDAPALRATENSAVIAFPEATGSWGTISHIALMDALTVGNMLWHAALDASQAVGSGQTLQVGVGGLDISFTIADN